MFVAANISPGPSNSSSLEPGKSGNHNLRKDIEKDTAHLQHHTTQEIKSPEYITGLPFGLVILSIFLVTFLTLLDTSIISTAIPRITDDFYSLPDVGWYGSAYQLASASLQPLTGKIYTCFPSKWCYLFFFGLFELGSLLCGAANTSKMLIVGRAVAGMGSSGIVNGGLTILASSLPLERRAIFTGLLLGFSQLGMVLGPLIGGALTEYSKWNWCFYLNLPVGGLAALLILAIRIPDQMEKESVMLGQLYRKLDLVGFVLFAPARIQLLLALHYGEDGWDSSAVIGLFCGAVATFGMWFAWNWRRGDDALIPFSMASRRSVWTSAITQMCLATSVLLSTYFLPIFFQAVQSRGPLISGLRMLPQIIPQILLAMVGGILVSKTGYPIPYATVGAVLTAVGSGLVPLLHPSSAVGQWVGFQVLCGVGRGLGSQMPIVAMQSQFQLSEISSAMSLLTFTQSLGTFIFLSISNTILDQSLRAQLGSQAEQVIAVGVTEFRDVVSPQNLPAVVNAYSKSVDRVFYLAAVGATSVATAQGMGWVDVRKTKKEPVSSLTEEKAAGKDIETAPWIDALSCG